MKRTASLKDIARDPRNFSKQIGSLVREAAHTVQQKIRAEITSSSDEHSTIVVAKQYLKEGKGDKAELELGRSDTISGNPDSKGVGSSRTT
jgi:hypothetical protein